MGNEANRKSPLPLLVPVRLMPCSVFLTAICALGTAAPLESVTVPVTEAVSCAHAACAIATPCRTRFDQHWIKFHGQFFSSGAILHAFRHCLRDSNGRRSLDFHHFQPSAG